MLRRASSPERKSLWSSFVLELTVRREFLEVQYLGALGFFLYPGNFELGAAATLDVTQTPLALGAISIVSYALD